MEFSTVSDRNDIRQDILIREEKTCAWRHGSGAGRAKVGHELRTWMQQMAADTQGRRRKEEQAAADEKVKAVKDNADKRIEAIRSKAREALTQVTRDTEAREMTPELWVQSLTRR